MHSTPSLSEGDAERSERRGCPRTTTINVEAAPRACPQKREEHPIKSTLKNF